MAKPPNAIDVDVGGRLKKSKPKARTAAIRVRMKPSVKAMAEQLAQKDARSLADWLERLIAAEAARRGGKK
jgi:predicted HicB family RNase H-like nuclease